MEFYRTYPRTRTGFDRQARALIDENGTTSFIASGFDLLPRTLFMLEGKLVAAIEKIHTIAKTLTAMPIK